MCLNGDEIKMMGAIVKNEMKRKNWKKTKKTSGMKKKERKMGRSKEGMKEEDISNERRGYTKYRISVVGVLFLKEVVGCLKEEMSD